MYAYAINVYVDGLPALPKNCTSTSPETVLPVPPEGERERDRGGEEVPTSLRLLYQLAEIWPRLLTSVFPGNVRVVTPVRFHAPLSVCPPPPPPQHPTMYTLHTCSKQSIWKQGFTTYTCIQLCFQLILIQKGLG